MRDLALYLEFAVPLRVHEIRLAREAEPTSRTPARLQGDITRGIGLFASNGDAVQYGTANRKTRARALDGLVTAVAAAVVHCGPMDVFGTHLCAESHDGCPIPLPPAPDPGAAGRVVELLDELAELIAAPTETP